MGTDRVGKLEGRHKTDRQEDSVKSNRQSEREEGKFYLLASAKFDLVKGKNNAHN